VCVCAIRTNVCIRDRWIVIVTYLVLGVHGVQHRDARDDDIAHDPREGVVEVGTLLVGLVGNVAELGELHIRYDR